jgi:hypothetical protein
MKYTGTLAKPIARKAERLLLAEALREENKLINQPYEDRIKKFPALFEAHSVPFGDWMGLALSLAIEHVPGFRIVNPAGRKTEWGICEKAELKIAVDDILMAHPGMKITDAMRRVQRLDGWKEKTKNMKIAALSKHYYSADDMWVAIMRDAKAYNSIIRND